MTIFLYYLGAFALGSIPFGWIVAHLKGIDIRKVGSGNIGATNVKRALGTKWGLFVFFLDVIKGVIPGLLAGVILTGQSSSISIPDHAVLGGVAAVLGHMLSPFMRFRGGKGIATGLGALLGAAWMVGLGAFSVFLIMMAITRIVSLSSVIAALFILICGWLFGQSPIFMGVYAVIVLVIWIKHIPNMKRLAKGEEPKFSFKKDNPAKEVESADDDLSGTGE